MSSDMIKVLDSVLRCPGMGWECLCTGLRGRLHLRIALRHDVKSISEVLSCFVPLTVHSSIFTEDLHVPGGCHQPSPGPQEAGVTHPSTLQNKQTKAPCFPYCEGIVGLVLTLKRGGVERVK